MAKVTTLFPDSGDKKSPVQLTSLNNLERTQQQVQTLLNIASNCENVLVFETEIGSSVEVEDDVQESATETYLAAHVQLRNIIDDMSRWGDTDSGEIQTRQLVEGNVNLLKKQQAAIDEQSKPHRRLNCQLRLFQNGWVAWVGAETPNSDTLHGIGTSPELALEAFDRNYAQHLAQVATQLSPTDSEQPPA
jgi:hypothetical protein